MQVQQSNEGVDNEEGLNGDASVRDSVRVSHCYSLFFVSVTFEPSVCVHILCVLSFSVRFRTPQPRTESDCRGAAERAH